MATLDRLRVTKIGNLGCPNHGGKSQDMILIRGNVLVLSQLFQKDPDELLLRRNRMNGRKILKE